jgi:hypothetical protein
MNSFILFRRTLIKTKSNEERKDIKQELKELPLKIDKSRITPVRGYSLGKEIVYLYGKGNLSSVYEINNPI